MWRSVDLVQASKNDSGTWLDFTTGGNDMLTNTIFLSLQKETRVGGFNADAPKES